MSRVLVIEDDRHLSAGLRANLEVEGYEVLVAEDGERGLETFRESMADVVILDLMLPGIDGFEVLRLLRQKSPDVPVLILSARAEEVDKVRGFRRGADDYITKPFSLMELIVRVEALLRRSGGTVSRAGPPPADPEVERFGDVEVNVASRTTSRGGQPVHLTPMAFNLLMALIRRRGRVATRYELMREVWDHQAEVQSRTVDAHVAELRRALELDPAKPRHIITVWKVGYRFEA
jgi:DNA-binding response OmpR family regulator